MFNLETDITDLSGLAPAVLDQYLARSGFAGLGGAFAALEQSPTHISALFAVAHGASESAWGTSYLAQQRNNLFGINAIDSNPNDAYAYPSKEACISYYGAFLRQNYLSPTGFAWAGGTTIHDVFVHYSSSHDVEGQHIADLMNQISANLQGFSPTTQPGGGGGGGGEGTYTVRAGDNLAVIAGNAGTTWQELVLLNEQSYPSLASNPNLVYPGWVLLLPSRAGHPPVASSTYIVQPGDSLWGIAERRLGNPLHWPDIAQLNHIPGPFYIIHPGETLRLP